MIHAEDEQEAEGRGPAGVLSRRAMNWVLWTVNLLLDETQGLSVQSHKTRVAIPGAERVIDQYRNFCIEQDARRA